MGSGTISTVSLPITRSISDTEKMVVMIVRYEYEIRVLRRVAVLKRIDMYYPAAGSDQYMILFEYGYIL